MIVQSDYCSFWPIGTPEKTSKKSPSLFKVGSLANNSKTESYWEKFWWTLAVAVFRLRVPVGVFMLDALKQDNSRVFSCILVWNATNKLEAAINKHRECVTLTNEEVRHLARHNSKWSSTAVKRFWNPSAARFRKRSKRGCWWEESRRQREFLSEGSFQRGWPDFCIPVWWRTSSDHERRIVFRSYMFFQDSVININTHIYIYSIMQCIYFF